MATSPTNSKLYKVASVLGIIAAGISSGFCSEAQAQRVPADTLKLCEVKPSDFKDWFSSAVVSRNGLVTPAKSSEFDSAPVLPNSSPNCEFYKWSERMFLWLTSPLRLPGAHEVRIFESDAFFDAVPSGSGQHALVRHDKATLQEDPGAFRHFSVRRPKLGPHFLPLIFDKAGRMFEVERPDIVADAKLQIIDRTGRRVQIKDARRKENGDVVLFDEKNEVIQPQVRDVDPPPGNLVQLPDSVRQLIQRGERQSLEVEKEGLRVQKFIVNGIPLYLDPYDYFINVEVGQGDQSVLESQTGSLVYYEIILNDLLAYFRTGVTDGAITGDTAKHFPDSVDDLQNIMTFVRNNLGRNDVRSIAEPNALAIEIKTSWVETTGLQNLGSYITTRATVPNYDKSDPDHWIQRGRRSLISRWSECILLEV
jgi:hypothetical protein